MGRLVLIEGIPGSGKTTLAGKTAEFLSRYKKTDFYEEGESHPADLAWCACIPKEEFENVIKQYPEYEEKIRQLMYEEEGYQIIPYTRLSIDDPDFYQQMESYEVYNNRVSLQVFEELHRKKWIKFAKQASAVDEFTVFECAFLQNHLNELLLFHFKEVKEIEEYLLTLIDTVKDLKPLLIYLNQPDIEETIRRVSEVRVDGQGKKIWQEMAIDYVENCPYGKKYGLKGFEGLVRYFEERKRIELLILNKLPIECHIINNQAYDWEQVWTEVEELLGNIAAQ